MAVQAALLSLPFLRRQPAAGRGFRATMAGWVMRRPALALVPALCLLVLDRDAVPAHAPRE
jgi:hypothetical protein